MATRTGPAWRGHVPFWLGGALQVLAACMLVNAIPVVRELWLDRDAAHVLSFFRIFAFAPVPTLLNAVVVYVVGLGITRRKRVFAWVLAALSVPTVALACYVAIASLTGVDPYGAGGDGGWAGSREWGAVAVPVFVDGAVSLAIICLLVACRREFSSHIPTGSWRRPALTLVGFVAASLATGAVLIALFPGTLHTASDRVMWLVNTTLGTVPNQILLDNVHGRPPHWVVFVTTSITAVGFVAALITFTRSSRLRLVMTPDEELEVRRLLLAPGASDSLGYFATRRDKDVVFSPSGDAAVAFSVFFGVALASGDPIGSPRHWPAAVTAWLERVRSYGWAPAVLGTSEAGARCYARAGLHTARIGDEAVIDVADFRTRARDSDAVRDAVRRARRAGYEVAVSRAGELSDAELSRLARCADDWREGGEERGFSMALSRFADRADDRSVVVTASDAEGDPRGLLVFVPWGTDGLSLDVMRRAPDAVHGVTELMVSELVAAADDLGVRRVSLNFAMFREDLERGARIGATPGDRARRRLVLVLSRWWQLDSLYRSNAKYLPHWRTRLVCYGREVSMARVVLAAGRAEGFLRRPAVPFRRLSRPPAVPRVGTRDEAFPGRVREVEARATEVVAPRVSPQRRAREEKLARLVAAGRPGHATDAPRPTPVADVVARHAGLGPGAATADTVTVTGRVTRRSRHGGVVFVDVAQDGTRLQVTAARGATGDFDLFEHVVQTGDVLSATGEVRTTPRGTLTVACAAWDLVAKCLDPDARDAAAAAGAAALDRGRVLGAVRGALSAAGFREADDAAALTGVVAGDTTRAFAVVRDPDGTGSVRAVVVLGTGAELLGLVRDAVDAVVADGPDPAPAVEVTGDPGAPRRPLTVGGVRAGELWREDAGPATTPAGPDPGPSAVGLAPVVGVDLGLGALCDALSAATTGTGPRDVTGRRGRGRRRGTCAPAAG